MRLRTLLLFVLLASSALIPACARPGSGLSPASPEELAARAVALGGGLLPEGAQPEARQPELLQPSSPALAAPAPLPTAQPKPEARYRITARKVDLEAVEGYPQTITRRDCTSSGCTLEIEIRRDPERLHAVPFSSEPYPAEIAAYLEPTDLIQSADPAVLALAESLRQPNDDVTAFAARAAAWTAKNIAYDMGLAQKIWNGRVDTQSALETLQRKKGTCSEYTNLFIALMRSQGVPARFVHGYLYKGMNHAWAEIYLDGIGWHPLDPQGGRGVSERHVRLFAGRDFAEIGVKLKEIGGRVEALK